ncbi:hypothetical protein MSM1_13085 [Mycobacterium sp. SM1]|uniref:hypothetical protein n=1 Tax=Mycobacterium sp. SM1 TaxID=2816243 RepID=UPI001BCD8523|nr:hypothetical protein [Mycobacterium sp. SM1]MBS4729231.1 hypothetical protein [Mycobacterium sp. SM1]
MAKSYRLAAAPADDPVRKPRARAKGAPTLVRSWPLPYLGRHVHTGVDGLDRLDLQAANTGWLHRQDVDEPPRPSRGAQARKRRGRRQPPSRRSVARIKARRQANTAKRQGRSARTSTAGQPTALAA